MDVVNSKVQDQTWGSLELQNQMMETEKSFFVVTLHCNNTGEYNGNTDPHQRIANVSKKGPKFGLHLQCYWLFVLK